MFQYRQVLVRLRQGDSHRDIARSGLMGRPKVALFHALAESAGWLAPEAALPDDAAIAALMAPARRASSTISRFISNAALRARSAALAIWLK